MLMGMTQQNGGSPRAPRKIFVRKRRYEFFKWLDELNNL